MIYEKNSRLRYLEFFKGMQLIQESLYRHIAAGSIFNSV